VNLEIQTREEKTVVGIWRDRSKGWPEGMDMALADAFAKKGHAGDANKWWAWSRTLPDEFGNWSAAHALFAMHVRKEEVVTYLSEQILGIHRVAAAIIDRYLNGKARRNAEKPVLPVKRL
jgi:hypothetical protein